MIAKLQRDFDSNIKLAEFTKTTFQMRFSLNNQFIVIVLRLRNQFIINDKVKNCDFDEHLTTIDTSWVHSLFY